MARLETGALQAGDDWPGVFIRGDNALMGYAPALAALIAGKAGPIQMAQCRSLLDLLRSANAHEGAAPQRVTLSKQPRN